MEKMLTSAIPLGHFNVLVTFVDGTKRIFHGKKLWKDRKRFLPLKDIDFFNQVGVYESQYTIGWPGDLEISPEWLMEWSEPVK